MLFLRENAHGFVPSSFLPSLPAAAAAAVTATAGRSRRKEEGNPMDKYFFRSKQILLEPFYKRNSVGSIFPEQILHKKIIFGARKYSLKNII